MEIRKRKAKKRSEDQIQEFIDHNWRFWLPLSFVIVFLFCAFVYSRFLNVHGTESKPTPWCPEYFRWIHEDLSPWRDTGISSEMVKKVQDQADFHLVILNGTAYAEIFPKSRSESSDSGNFTLWGIVQLLRRYPGKIPDLDLMFHTGVRPVIKRYLYTGNGKEAPPPLFGYAGDDDTLDIAFPDWSFWGWPKRVIKGWEGLSKELKEGNKRSRWEDRDQHACWRGALSSPERMELANCNVSDKHDWNARIYNVDRNEEKKQQKQSQHCDHRYNIYMEGGGWSASEKYILGCDSVTLRVKPRFYSFFSRNLMPLQHFWPINPHHKCRSIKYAVEWGNARKEEAQSIGKEASSFIEREMKMDHVYNYMLHLLQEYAKLLTYKPSVPARAIRLGVGGEAAMAAVPETGASTSPCSLPPPYDPKTILSMLEWKENATKLVEQWEKQYWNSTN